MKGKIRLRLLHYCHSYSRLILSFFSCMSLGSYWRASAGTWIRDHLEQTRQGKRKRNEKLTQEIPMGLGVEGGSGWNKCTVRPKEKERMNQTHTRKVWMCFGQRGLNFLPQTGLKLDTGLRTRQSSFNTPVIVDQITYSECSLSLFSPSGRALSEILFALNRHILNTFIHPHTRQVWRLSFSQ